MSGDEVEQAFQQLKQHLATLPKIISTLLGETLYIYLSVSEYTPSAVLVAEREGAQHPVWFISHTYRGAEARYNQIKNKMVFAPVMASRKLKPYFPSTSY